MRGHTPGPWTVNEDAALVFCRKGDHREPAVAQVAPIDYAVVWLLDADERCANARLVAAAPDLLEAAQRALAFLQDNGMSHGADLARAIAKAEGRS